MRHYKSGQPSLILFPDGSGNAFYSNGSVAVSVINLIEGKQNQYILQVNAFIDLHVLCLFVVRCFFDVDIFE